MTLFFAAWRRACRRYRYAGRGERLWRLRELRAATAALLREEMGR